MQGLVELYNKTRYLYEKYYDIHICAVGEIDEVVGFIDTYWQKGHILTKSRELLDWQHFDRANNRYNFVLAKLRETGEIHGIIGFIMSNIYDTKIQTPIRWRTMWKIREEAAVKGLGIALKGYMESAVPAKYIGGVGLSKYSRAIDEKLGERMGRLCQYYIANPDMDEYILIDKPERNVWNIEVPCAGIPFVEIKEHQFEENAEPLKDTVMPYKSVAYYMNRYFKHPVYEYKCYKTCSHSHRGVADALLFCRKCQVGNASNIFVVDYIGDGAALSFAKEGFIELLRTEHAECIIFPCDGIDERYMRQAGFLKRDDSAVTLPIYYEPFVRQNMDLDFHFWSEDGCGSGLIVKGDADQDRPNRLVEECYE